MAPVPTGKVFFHLSLVTCPVALYPATSDSEKISFNQINRKTGHRIKYAKVDADTGEEVSNPGRESDEGHARSGEAHRQPESLILRAREV
jgi:non-homologous end joining protein Ku